MRVKNSSQYGKNVALTLIFDEFEPIDESVKLFTTEATMTA